MPWVRFDDHFPLNRKVDGLSDTAFRLHVAAIFWCARNLTDGAVPEEDLDLVTARVRAPARFAAQLVARGLWHEAGYECDSPNCPKSGPNGWVIHDYLEFQPAKQKVERERKAKADRQARWRANKTKGGGLSTASGQVDTSHDASQDASVDVAPPRPAPKEAGRGRPAAPPAAAGRRDGGGGELNGNHTHPRCDDCGNRTNAAYHRRNCAKGTP